MAVPANKGRPWGAVVTQHSRATMEITKDADPFEKLHKLTELFKADYLEYYGILPISIGEEEAVVGYWLEQPNTRTMQDIKRVFNRAIRLEKIEKDHGARAARRLYGQL